MDVDPHHQRPWKFSPASDISGPEPTAEKMIGNNSDRSEGGPLIGPVAVSSGDTGSVVNAISNDRIWQERLESISEKSRMKIQQILDEIHLLLPIELMLLYMKLPAENKDPPDPLRQPLNPLGSRSEICQTITWIKTHLEEDPDISLQKKGVYEEYRAFCELNNIKSLSTADFGKVMKQVYPRVRPRRLGTRGNSQYCYSGLRKRMKLPTPTLPDLSDRPQSTEPTCSKSDLMAAAWTVVKEWSEGQLGLQFCSLHSLALHLVVKCSVGVGTAAASIVTSTEVSRSGADAPHNSTIYINKHKEMTLQLQRKIQQKNSAESAGYNGRDIKRKVQSQSPKVDHRTRAKKCKVQTQPALLEGSSSSLPPMVAPPDLPSTLHLQPQTVCDKSLDYSTTGSGVVTSTTVGTPVPSPTAVINNQLRSLPDFSSFHRQQQGPPGILPNVNSTIDSPKESNSGLLLQQGPSVGTTVIEGKVAIPRLLTSRQQPQPPSPPKRGKGGYKAIQPKPSSLGPLSLTTSGGNIASEQSCDTLMYNPQTSAELARSQQQEKPVVKRKQRRKSASNSTMNSNKDKIVMVNNNDNNVTSCSDEYSKKELAECFVTPLEDDGEPIHFSRERLISISKVSKDEIECYLGNSNSQEEEELEKYFENNNTTQQEQTLEGSTSTTVSKVTLQHQHFSQQDSTTKQLSQVRQLLEQKFISSDLGGNAFTSNKPTNVVSSSFKSVPTTPLPTAVNQQMLQSASNARRRVSFDTHNFEEVVPPSPNTRCKNLNFTPISPGPKSPPLTGRHSKSSSNNASPFVSPRNTPVPRMRGNSHPYPTCTNVPTGLLNLVNTRKNLKSTKVKPELELKLDNSADNTGFRSMGMHHMGQPMSAPPSPKMKLLQTLLQSKISYTPDYAQNQIQQQMISTASGVADASSPEIWRLVGNVPAQPQQNVNMESQFRSQSVPLPTIPDQCFTHFPFDEPPQNTDPTLADQGESSNDFNDIDTFPTSENINVTKIIDEIDILDTNNVNMSIPQEYNNAISTINEERIGSLDQETYSQVNLVPRAQENVGPPLVMVGQRWISRAQSLDVEDYTNSMKCPSSRSVPATPVPYPMACRKMSPEKVPMGNNSRSYPSTPLTNETFSYTTQGHDFLLNGQPIKEKITINPMSFVGNEAQEGHLPEYRGMIINEGADDVLMGSNKVNFVDGQMTPDQGCDIMESDYTFDGVSDLNGS